MKIVIGILIGICLLVGITIAIVCIAVGKLEKQGEYLDECYISTIKHKDRKV